MKVKCGIYKIENLKNGKVYIGKSVNIFSRWKSHLFSLDNGSHYNINLQTDFSKYGVENFTFQVLEFTNKDNLDNREMYHIEQHCSANKEYGYNIIGKKWTRSIEADLDKKFDLIVHNINDISYAIKKIEPNFLEKNNLFSLGWYKKRTDEELRKYGMIARYYFIKIKKDYEIRSAWTCPENYFRKLADKGIVRTYIEPDCSIKNECKYQSIYFAHNIYPNFIFEKYKEEYTKKFLINFIENNCDITKEIHVCSPSIRMTNILKEISINE